MSGTEKKGTGGGKSRHVKSARALRYLFASGILKGSGKGKGREVSYDRKRAGQVKAITDKTGGKGSATYRRKTGRAAKTRHNHNTNAAKRQPSLAKSALGMKAAHLRGGASGMSAKEALTPSRGTRLARGLAIANSPATARKALKGSGLTVREAKDKGPNIFGQGKGPLTATGKNTRLQGDTRFLVRTARKDGKLKPRWEGKGQSGGETGGSGRRVPSKAERDATRASRVGEGRATARAYLESEKGQHLRSGVLGLASANRRTGRRDYDKPKKVRAAKDELRAAGVKIKTGEALARRMGHGLSPRLNGDYSGRTFVRATPKFAEQQRQAARRKERADAREKLIAPLRGLPRAERVSAAKALADENLIVQLHRSRKDREAKARAESERAAARDRRLQGRRNREQRRERKAEEARVAAQAERETARRRRAGARDRRVQKVAQLKRKQGIKAGLKVLSDFRAHRDSLYNGKLF